MRGTPPRCWTTWVRRCRLLVLKLELGAPLISALEAKICYTAFKCCFQIQLSPLHLGLVVIVVGHSTFTPLITPLALNA